MIRTICAAITRRAMPCGPHLNLDRHAMNKDQWIREKRNQAATWHGVVGVYALIVGTMVLTGMAIT